MILKISHGTALSSPDIYELYLMSEAYPGYAECFLKSLREGRVRSFCDMDQWKEYIQAHQIRLCIGTRVHGSIIAMNAGVPAVCTAGDSRALEMCSYLGIPHKPGIYGINYRLSDLNDFFDSSLVRQNYFKGLEVFKNWILKNKLPMSNNLLS